MIRKLKSGEYRLYSVKKDPKTGKRRNLGTFKTRAAAEKHEREVQYFKHAKWKVRHQHTDYWLPNTEYGLLITAYLRFSTIL